MSYPDEEKHTDYHEIYCAAILVIYFGIIVTLLSVGMYTLITN